MSNPVLDAFYSLGRNLNKASTKVSTETEDGVASERLPELSLDMDNQALISLTNKWNDAWLKSNVYGDWKKRSDENENYWKGKHFQRPEVDKTRAIVDNVIFESLETYLPQITQRNPEPMVKLDEELDQSSESLQYAKQLQKELGEIADELRLRLKLKKGGRHWAIYLVGIFKLGWDLSRDMPTVKVIRPARMIFDPNATVDEDGYTGEYIGEHRKLQASILIKTLEGLDAEKGAIDTIKAAVKGDLGTEVGFIEWWTNEYMCWTMKDQVLFKSKNPHWNYDQQVPAPADAITGTTPVDENGQPRTVAQPGFNHLAVPGKPYVLLSVFNLGTQPVDDTSLITQNLSNQDIINKRIKQIDKNADSMNGGLVVSGANSGLTKEQAKGVTEALRKGGTVYIPSGTPSEAVQRFNANPLPGDVYNQLVDIRNRTRDIFGTRGTTPANVESEKTARGKLLVQQLDTSRIGGGISEYIEQVADEIYNWFIQLLYVYDDTYSQQKNKPKIKVSVKEGSLLPKDSTTLANQAVDLAAEGKMSLIDLYKHLDYPNPEELAANVWLEANAPELLYANDPRVQQAIQMKQQAAAQQGGGAKPPSESINFKDLPPDGKVQMAAKAGISLHPEAVAAHEELVASRDKRSSAPPAVMPPNQ